MPKNWILANYVLDPAYTQYNENQYLAPPPDSDLHHIVLS